MDRDLEQIYSAGLRAKELVLQILTFSRLSEDELIVLQPARVVKEALKMLRASIPTTISITENIDYKIDTIWANPTQLHQIVMNLSTNAYHAM